MVDFGGRRFTYHFSFEARLALILTNPQARQTWRYDYAEGIGIEFLVMWDDLADTKVPGRRRLLTESVAPFPTPGVVWFDATVSPDGLIEIRSVGFEGLTPEPLDTTM